MLPSGLLVHIPPRAIRFAPLMDMDFAVRCPLVRYSRLASGFCPSTRAFAWCFLQTPPRGDSPCTLLALHLHQVERRTFTSKLLSMPSTQRCRYRGIEVVAAVDNGNLRESPASRARPPRPAVCRDSLWSQRYVRRRTPWK